MINWFRETVFEANRKKVAATFKEVLNHIDWKAVPTTLVVLGDDPNNVITNYVKVRTNHVYVLADLRSYLVGNFPRISCNNYGHHGLFYIEFQHSRGDFTPFRIFTRERSTGQFEICAQGKTEYAADHPPGQITFGNPQIDIRDLYRPPLQP